MRLFHGLRAAVSTCSSVRVQTDLLDHLIGGRKQLVGQWMLERAADVTRAPGCVSPAAAQPRIVSVARIRLDSRKSGRSFKGIFCADVSEFESHMPSHAVVSTG